MNEFNGRRFHIAAFALLLVAAIGPFAQTAWHDFATYDDGLYVTNNRIVQQGITWAGVRWAFTTFHACNWHPLTWLSHMLDCQVFAKADGGQWAGGHHLINGLLHAINTLLVCLTLHNLTGWFWRSAAVAAVFAVHPLHVESVAWISERKELLSALFGLMAILCYARYLRGESVAAYLAMLICFVLSLLSKPMLVTLPFLLLVLDWWPLKRFATRRLTGGQMELDRETLAPNRPGRGRPVSLAITGPLLDKVPLLIMSLAMSMMTMVAQSSGEAMQTLEAIPLPTRISNAVVAYSQYLLKTVWPADLAVFYPYPPHRPGWHLMLAALALMAITVIAIVQVHRRPWLLAGWLWFLGTLVPVIGLVQVGMQSMADRYMYFPIIGLLVMAIWSVRQPRTAPARSGLWGFAVVIIAALTTITFIQTGYWRKSVTLFERALAVTPENFLTSSNLGHAYLIEQDYARAIPHLEKGVALNPSASRTHNNLGIALFRTGQVNRAIEHYRRAIDIQSDYAGAYANLGQALLSRQQLSEALAQCERAVSLDPDLPEGHAHLGLALATAGQFERAITHLQRAVDLKPTAAKTRINLAAALDRLGRTEQAIAHLQHAIRLQPELADAHYNLGMILAGHGRVDEAIIHLAEAARLRPHDLALLERLRILQDRAREGPQ